MFCRMLPESPRWLLAQGNVEEAYKVLSRAAQINGVKISDIDATLKKFMTKAIEVSRKIYNSPSYNA